MHVANGLNLLSFLVKDILWLRLLSICAGVLWLFVMLLRPDPQLAAAAWTALFMTINGVQSLRLVLERRPLRLSGDAQHLHQLVFRGLRPQEFRGLTAVGDWEHKKAQDFVVRAGEPLPHVRVLVRGTAKVQKDRVTLTELCEGQFVGEMAFVTGEHPQVDVVASDDALFFAWRSDALRDHLAEHPELRAQLQGLLGADLARKLRQQQGLAQGTSG
jgi:CRP-like cAMP-binding protein